MHQHHIAEDASEIKAERKKLTPDQWYRRYARDYHEGTRELTLAERGAYSDILDMIYMAGAPLKDDERMIAYKLHVDVRTWRPIRNRLLALGKLYLVRGCLHNARAKTMLSQREIERRSMGDRPGIAGGSRPDRPGIDRDLFENINDFNGNSRPTSTELASKKEEVETEGDNIIPLRASQERLAGQGGVADLMIRDVVVWMNGDEKCAREWLTNQVGIYGEKVVRDSYAKLRTDLASGKIITRPLQTWCSIAGRLHGQPSNQPAAHGQGGSAYKSPRVVAAEQARAAARKFAAGRKT